MVKRSKVVPDTVIPEVLDLSDTDDERVKIKPKREKKEKLEMKPEKEKEEKKEKVEDKKEKLEVKKEKLENEKLFRNRKSGHAKKRLSDWGLALAVHNMGRQYFIPKKDSEDYLKLIKHFDMVKSKLSDRRKTGWVTPIIHSEEYEKLLTELSNFK